MPCVAIRGPRLPKAARISDPTRERQGGRLKYSIFFEGWEWLSRELNFNVMHSARGVLTITKEIDDWDRQRSANRGRDSER